MKLDVVDLAPRDYLQELARAIVEGRVHLEVWPARPENGEPSQVFVTVSPPPLLVSEEDDE